MAKVPIAITGMHRSGTSMITRVLHDSGLHLVGSDADELLDAANDNPEGFWENKAIVACNEALLEATGGAWDNPPELPPQAIDDPRVAHIAEAATAAITALSEHDHWGFKDPRLCLTAGYWRDLEPDLRFVICVRHPLEVALSLKRRNQNSYSLGLALWERYYASVLELVPPDRRIVTHYDTFFLDPVGEVARLCAFADLDPAPPRVSSELRHHTTRVALGEAGAGSRLRALYAELCREAGAPLPVEAPTDEGRVRRLILDGAVAQRHADQRQAAIDRLQEREAELRQRIRELEEQRSATERDHRQRMRELEVQTAARVDALQADTIETLRSLTTSATRVEGTLADIDQRTQTTATRLEVAIAAVEPGPIRVAARRSAGRAVRAGRRLVLRPGRRLLGKGRRVAAPAVTAVTHQLPQPAQQALTRGRRLIRRGIADPVPTAKAVRRRLDPLARRAARRATRRLPPPAVQALRRGRSGIQQATTAPIPTAKRVARRLPPGAQQQLRRVWRAMSALEKAAGPSPAASDGPTPRPTPKGPALREWRDAYQRMVAASLPEGQPWLVITPGSPAEVRDATAPRATPFPDTRDGRPLADDLAHIAHLEALRFSGLRQLVLPEGSRPWLRQQAALRDHILGTYRTMVDEPGAGAVFDLTEIAHPGSSSLRGEVTRLGAGLDHPPAVLNWTSQDLAAELPGLAAFQPPPGDRLPYLDHSIDLVVVDDERFLAEANRVATRGVITLAPGGIDVIAVDARTTEGLAPPARVLVWSNPGADNTWETHLAERVTLAGADLLITAEGGRAELALGDHDVVVAVEPYVLPLPGAIEMAAALAVAQPSAAVAGKILRHDGRLEAAGGTVFFDRSVALIAGASPDVRAPWHDYVRPVCWAPGFLACSTTLWSAVPLPDETSSRPFLRELCAEVWAQGSSVVYQPSVVAVRVTGDGGEPSTPLLSSRWQRVLDLRPARPRELSDGAWRYLLAHDDVEACRG